MTLRKLALLGHPVLLTHAEPIADLGRSSVQTLINDMLATMIDADGIGLAAPQVHESLRLIVALELQDRAERGTAFADVPVKPELTPVGEGRELAFEGCLSIPDLRGRVPRHASVAYRALDRHGREVRGVATWLVARGLEDEEDDL